MKKLFHCAAAWLPLSTLSHPLATVHTQGTALTHQGRLNNSAWRNWNNWSDNSPNKTETP
jgi:hypothetical protein